MGQHHWHAVQPNRLQSALNNKAASSHSHTVSDITASGTADATTYLRGDGSWAAPPSGGGDWRHRHQRGGCQCDRHHLVWQSHHGVWHADSHALGQLAELVWHRAICKGGLASPTFAERLPRRLQQRPLTPRRLPPRPTSSRRATTNAGTVTSVAFSGGTTGLSASGGPITSSGTLTLAGTLAVANGGTGATSAGAALTALGGLASSSYTASDVLSKLLTVDGAASGLDSGLLDGQHGATTRPSLPRHSPERQC